MLAARSWLPIACVVSCVGCINCVHTGKFAGNDEGRIVKGLCDLQFYRLPPQAPYQEVGHGFVSSGEGMSRAEAEAELNRQACSLQADAVVVTQESYGGRGGSLVRGRFIRFPQEDKPGGAAKTPAKD